MGFNFALHRAIKEHPRFGMQYKFADEIGTTDSYVSKVVRGRNILSDEDKVRWATLLNKSVSDIFPAEVANVH